MRLGVPVEHQMMQADDRRYFREVIAPGGESLAEQRVEQTEEVSFDPGDGTTLPAFTLGLHNPFDTLHPTWFPGG